MPAKDDAVKVQWATVVPGTETPAGDGKSGALRCVLALEDGTLVGAILKRDPPELVFAELLGALLLKAWGLPVPAPYLVSEGSTVAFASSDVGYPNLKKRMGLDNFVEGSPAYLAALSTAMTFAKNLESAPLAAVLDEVIDNRDRNLGNILWDGAEEVWIDHALAFGNGAARGFQDLNKLCMCAVATGDHADFMSAVMERWQTVDSGAVSPSADVIDPHFDSSAWRALVAARLADLGMRLLGRFPKPADLLH